MLPEERIELSEKDIIGKGCHKATYAYPGKKNLCVKLVYTEPDVDVIKEMSYRDILKKKQQKKSLLTNYYGTVQTNYGKGYVFDRVVDYDGNVSKDFKFILENVEQAEAMLHCKIFDVFLTYRQLMLTECIVTSDTDPVNIMVQRLSPDSYQLKIIDNIGTPVFVPLAYFFRCVAVKRAYKYWNIFVDRCHDNYGHVFSSQQWQQLHAELSWKKMFFEP